MSQETPQLNEFVDPFKDRSMNKGILYLALPVFISEGVNALSNFFNRVIMGQLGETAFNSINIGSQVFFLIVIITAAVGVGATTLVAQNWGTGNRERANQIMQQGVVLGFIICLLISAFGLATRRILFAVFGTDPTTVELGLDYLFWLYLGLPIISPGFFMASALRGSGDTKTPMMGGLFMAGLSLFLSYGLILGRMGLPRLEVEGAALALILSFFVFSIIMAGLILVKRTELRFSIRNWKPDITIWRSILKIGIPSATEWLLIQAGFLIYIAVISKYGKEALAGYFTGIAMLSIAQATTMGFQVAATTLVGQMVGAKRYNQAGRIFYRTATLCFFIMIAFGLLFLLIIHSFLFPLMFNKLSLISLKYARIYISLLAISMPLMGITYTLSGGLRGSGYTTRPLIASAIGMYGGRIIFAYMVYYFFHPPIIIVLCSVFPDHIIRSTLLLLGIRSGKWKKIKVKL